MGADQEQNLRILDNAILCIAYQAACEYVDNGCP
jgi:hypothetical protein